MQQDTDLPTFKLTVEQFEQLCPYSFDEAMKLKREATKNGRRLFCVEYTHSRVGARYLLRDGKITNYTDLERELCPEVVNRLVQPTERARPDVVVTPKARTTKPDDEREVRNGVKRPRDGSAGEAAWQCHDDANGDRALAKQLGEQRGLNVGNVNTEYRLWAKFHGRD